MPVTRHLRSSDAASLPPAKPASSNAHDTSSAEVEPDNYAVLFDARPADPVKPGFWVWEYVKAGVSHAFKAVRDTLMAKFGFSTLSSIRSSQNADVSRPFNVVKGKIPDQLALAIEEAAREKRQQAEDAHRDAFVSGANVLPAKPQDAPDDFAFDQYLKAYRQRKDPNERVLCQQNFEAGARRVATQLLQANAEREAYADAKDKTYWLAPEQKERLDAAATLMESDADPATRKLAKDFLRHGPVQTSTEEQCRHFLMWRQRQDFDPRTLAESSFDLEAALAHASTLLATYAGKEQSKDSEDVRQWVNDATQLVARSEEYKTVLIEVRGQLAPLPRHYDVLDELSSLLDEVLAPQADSLAQSMSKDDAADQTGAASSHNARSEQDALQSPGSTGLPPSPPPPRPTRSAASGMPPQRTLAEEFGLPPVSDLTAEDIERATMLFNQFTKLLSESPQGVSLERSSPYLYPECVAVANDFAEMVAMAPDLALSTDQQNKLVAALRLREMYSRYLKAGNSA